MLNKLSWRNARRSMKDYLVYIMTMVLITAVMFSFNSMIFSPSIQALYTEAVMMATMIGMADFFVVIIVVWLVHYMVKFLAQCRSREFATYLLLGFRKKKVAGLFLRENVIMGLAAFMIGLIPGFFLQQVMVTLIHAVVGAEYTLHLEINAWTFLVTAGVYILSFALALFRNKSRFKRMNIHDMMYLDRQNEVLKGGNRSGKKWMLFAAIAYIIFFGIMLYGEWINFINVWPLVLGLVFAVYFMYMGLAAFLVGFIRKGGEKVLQRENLFILRQLSSKIKTMQFTLGTLTILFAVALVGSCCAMMLNRFQNTYGEVAWPFDIAVYSEQPDADFARELSLIHENVRIADSYIYRIYHNQTNKANSFLKDKLGLTNWMDSQAYFQYDTYMKLSDYNRLREMLGYEQTALGSDEYLIHTKTRLKKEMKEFGENSISIQGREYRCGDIRTEPFEQSGHNGADYILVVPDEAADAMTPYYSVLMAQCDGEPAPGLGERLMDILNKRLPFELYDTTGELLFDYGFGTDQIYIHNCLAYVRQEEIPQMKIMLTALIFPLFYIGLVFLCVALTVLAVQQLSDAGKYRFRYDILRKLGLREKEVHSVILRQLSWYYLFPFLAALLLSIEIAGWLSSMFAVYSGVADPAWSYLFGSTLLFGAVYLLYFAATYVEFRRNV